MGRDIGKSTAGEVRIWCVVFFRCRADVTGQVCTDSGGLIGRLREVVAETTRTGYPCHFRGHGLGTSDGSDVGTRSGELWSELRGFLAVVGLARGADACHGIHY